MLQDLTCTASSRQRAASGGAGAGAILHFGVGRSALTTALGAADLPACVYVGSATLLSAFGVLRFTDNTCEARSDAGEGFSSSALPAFLGGVVSVSNDDGPLGFPASIQRCNSVNGAVWLPVKCGAACDDVVAALQLVSAPCGRCDLLIDCFAPLLTVAPTAFTRLAGRTSRGPAVEPPRRDRPCRIRSARV